MRREVGAAVAAVMLTVTTVAAPTLATVTTETADPSSWACSSAHLDLDEVVVELAPVAEEDTESDGSPVAMSPRDDGLWVPVVLVHGWRGSATHPRDASGRQGSFSHRIDLNQHGEHSAVSRSLVGQLQGIPGAAVFTYDYRPYSTRWVTDRHIGDGLGSVIDCLAEVSGQEVIVVAHSMGGLAAQYAAAGGQNGPDRADSLATVVTLGTPFEGSMLALLTSGGIAGIGSTKVGLPLRVLMTVCGRATTVDGPDACAPLPSLLTSFDGAAGRALQAGSPELGQLPPWPSGVTVRSIAGTLEMKWPGAGFFDREWTGTSPFDMGDLVVGTTSALGHGTPYPQGTCQPVSATLSADLTTVTFEGRLFDSACYHDNLTRATLSTLHTMFVVQDDIAARSRLTLDAPLVGVWTGDVDQPGSAAYSIRVTISLVDGEYEATVSYPELGCVGTWEQDEVAEEQVRMTEKILSGGRCASEVPVRLTLRDDGDVDLYFDYGGGASAVLRRTPDEPATWPDTRDDAPGTLYAWLGAAAAWPDAPDIEYPAWTACDDNATWCLLGGTRVHTLVTTEPSHRVVARLDPMDPEPLATMVSTGVPAESASQVLAGDGFG